MKKWEYTIFFFPKEKIESIQGLSKFGKEGWRVIHVSENMFAALLEREIPETEEPAPKARKKLTELPAEQLAPAPDSPGQCKLNMDEQPHLDWSASKPAPAESVGLDVAGHDEHGCTYGPVAKTTPQAPASPDKTGAYPAFPSWEEDDDNLRENQ
ncbi:MAG: hypothetical protein WC711_01765 [Candidatus Staskawiczbacteria bacterium]|jgi:hypothetical protein